MNILSVANPAVLPARLAPIARPLAAFGRTAWRRIGTGGLIGAAEAVPEAIKEKETGEALRTLARGGIWGAGRTAAGEIPGKAFEVGYRGLTFEPIKERIKGAVFEKFGRIAPWISDTPIVTNADFHKTFVSDQGIENLGRHFQDEIDQILSVSGNPTITVPSLSARPLPLSEAFNEVQKLGRLAWRGGMPTAEKLARQERHIGALDQIENQLTGSLKDAWRAARQNYREGHATIELVRKANVTKGGDVDLDALRNALDQSERAVAFHKKHPKGLDELIKTLNQGAGPLQGREVPGQLPGLRFWFGPGGSPRFGISGGRQPDIPGSYQGMPQARSFIDAITSIMARPEEETPQ
jgi:hypothetical protein